MYANNQISTIAGACGTGAIQSTQAQDAPRESTALDAHLSYLRNLQEQAAAAANRAMRIADRLFGQEPAAIGKGTDGGIKSPGEPPMTVQIEDAARMLANLVENFHQHLTRLERL